MNNAQRMGLVMAVFNMIFACKSMALNAWSGVPKPQGFEPFIVGWNPRGFLGGIVRGIDVDVNDGSRILNLRFMEQNPNKTDKNGNLKQTAIRARSGERIMWLIDRKAQTNAFLGSVQNGQWIASEMRAAVPVQNQQSIQIANIPDIPSNMSIPGYVVQTADGGQYTMTAEESIAADELNEMAMSGGFDMGMYENEFVEDYGNEAFDEPY